MTDTAPPAKELGPHPKATLLTRRHIIKGSSGRLPFAALNEHLCMQVLAKVLPTARTEVSRDGNALVVYRFDVDGEGNRFGARRTSVPCWACVPQRSTRRRGAIARAVRDHVPGSPPDADIPAADCNFIAHLCFAECRLPCKEHRYALYPRADDIFRRLMTSLRPASTRATNSIPPGIGFLGKKTWTPGKNLMKFVTGTFGVSAREQSTILESISDSIAETVPLVREKMAEHPGFRDIGKRMLLAWQEGITGLRDGRVYAAGDWPANRVFEGISDPPKLEAPRSVVGRSPLLSDRSKRASRENKPCKGLLCNNLDQSIFILMNLGRDIK